MSGLNNLNGRNFKSAFTLSEVLITLGIIGVVAAMTMPSLIVKSKEKETVAKLKKVYSTISQAFLMSINDNSTPDNWDSRSFTEDGITNRSGIVVDNFVKELKIAKDCGYGAKGCFAKSYEILTGGSDRSFEDLTRYYKVILLDGSSLAIEGSNIDSCISTSICGEIWVDINGPRKPNVIGKDVFFFNITKNKIKIRGEELTNGDLQTGCRLTINGPGENRGYECSSWVLINENMDYLHCNDLNWDTKTKCR